jgi:hypothetical protein
MSSSLDYNSLRLVTTSLVTYLGARGVLADTRYPNTNFMRTVFSAYIAMDVFMTKLTPSTAIHHALVFTSAAMCYRPVTGDDHVAISDMLPESCVCEGMAALACVDVATGRRYREVVAYMHLLNLAFVRFPMWSKCRSDYTERIRNDRLKMGVTAMLTAMLGLDAYWFMLILKGLLLKENKTLVLARKALAN